VVEAEHDEPQATSYKLQAGIRVVEACRLKLAA